MLFGWTADQGEVEAEEGKGEGTDEQPLSDKPLLIRCGKITVPGSSNLILSFSGAQKTFWVKKMKEKCVSFY